MFHQYGDAKGSVESGERDRQGCGRGLMQNIVNEPTLITLKLEKKYFLARALVHLNKFPDNVSTKTHSRDTGVFFLLVV